MQKSILKKISLVALVALMPFTSYAAGLGKLNVMSGLGEPLKAEIELLSVTPQELSGLVATVASEESYAAQGLTHSAIHKDMSVTIDKNSNGAPVLKLASRQPVNDPYLDVLMQVDWSTGRLVREYTMLLDPPGYKQNIANSTPASIQAPTSSPKPEAAPTSATITNKPAVATGNAGGATPLPAPINRGEANAADVTTQKGDTLMEIARQTQIEGVSLDQMLVGLYENNRSAFVGSNMNRLKVGQIIRIPSKDELAAKSERQARKAVRVHAANWNAYRNNLAGAVAATPAQQSEEPKQTAQGRIETSQDKANVAGASKDIVKLSAGESNKKGTGDKVLQDKLTSMLEEATAKDKALQESQERIKSLEKQVQDMLKYQKLLEMKSQTMAQIEKNAAEANRQKESEKAKPTDAPVTDKKANTLPKDNPKDASNPKSETQAELGKEVSANNPPTTSATTVKANESPATVAAQPEAKPAESATAPVANKVPPPAVVYPPAIEEPNLLGALTDAVDLTVLGGVTGVAVLGAAWMYLRNRRKRDLDSFERGILTSGGLRANTVFGNTTGNISSTDTSFLTDFAQGSDGAVIDSNDVDPIAEAEVYMAYGRDEQAELILKEAIGKEPSRYALHMKLLEIYVSRNDTSAFEAVAGELYTSLGEQDPVWHQIATMGIAIEPNNPLYAAGSHAAPSEANKATAHQVAQQASTATPLNANDFSDARFATDLDFGAESIKTAQNTPVFNETPPSSQNEDLSFDLDIDDNELNENLNQNLNGDFESAHKENAQDLKGPATKNMMVNTKSDGLNFDLSSLSLGENNAFESEKTQTLAVAPSNHPPLAPSTAQTNDEAFQFEGLGTLEMPSFEMPSAQESVSNETTTAFDTVNLEDIQFDLAEPDATQTMNFTQHQTNQNPAIQNPENIDEEITLDLSGEENTDVQFHSFETVLASAESSTVHETEDVNVKLDLVKAYIDMEDVEGARELLQEVLKEGGPKQQQRAQEMLSALA